MAILMNAAAQDARPRYVVFQRKYVLGHACYVHVKTFERWLAVFKFVERRQQVVWVFGTTHDTPGVPRYQAEWGNFTAQRFDPTTGWQQQVVPVLPFFRKVSQARAHWAGGKGD